MAKRVGWGLIGASAIAHERAIDAIRAQPGSEIVSVLSTDAARGERYAREHAIPRSTTQLEELLADPGVDAVYVSTTNELHCAQTVAAAQAGKHVMCEKPLAMTVAEARRMTEACSRAGVVLATHHHMRGAESHREIRRLVGAGAIGRPLYARVCHAGLLPKHLQGWRLHNPAAGGGVVLDLTVHDVDALRFVLGMEPVQAIAFSQQAGLAQGDLADGAMSVVRFEGGLLAEIHDAFTVKHALTALEVHGTDGSLLGRNVMGQSPVGEVILRDAAGERTLPLAQEDLYARTMAAFVAAVHGEGAPLATGEDGLRSLATALAVDEATRTGRCVDVRYT